MTELNAIAHPVVRASEVPDDDRLVGLRDLFPEAFSEGRVDFDKLSAVLGAAVNDQPERYSFHWAGKRDAQRILRSPSRATLVPVPEESLDWETTGNVFIEGENLEVLKLLYKSYFGRIKLIYIDPPYNTGNDFIYSDDYSDPLEHYLTLTGQKDESGNLLTSNPETGGRYHSNWLSMMYPRLFLARQLLRDDGAIFVSIDDHEVHNLRLLMNEIFGEENFITTVIWQKVYSPKNSAKFFSEDHDYIVVYARNADNWSRQLLARTAEMDARYSNPDDDPRGAWKSSGLDARNFYSKGTYSITTPSGRVISGPPSGRYWSVSREKFDELDRDMRIWWGEDGNSVPSVKRFLSEVKQGKVPQTLWTYDLVGHTQEAKQELLDLVTFEETDNVLDTVKPARLIQRIIQIALDPSAEESETVLDFFSGSGVTGHAVLAQNRVDGGNRRFICVQLPEPLPKPESALQTIADIGKTRLRNASQRLRNDSSSELNLAERVSPEDLGFRIFKLAESNFEEWQEADIADGASYVHQLDLYADPLLPGWKLDDVIWEVALKEGFPFSSKIERMDAGTDSVFYRVADPDRSHFIVVCLDDRVSIDAVRALELGKDDRFVCRDVALDDSLAANLALEFRLLTL
jgi:adenine-specific DNA-methyltransferase